MIECLIIKCRWFKYPIFCNSKLLNIYYFCYRSIKEKKEEETTLENYKHADELNFSIIKEEIKNKLVF